MVEDKEKGKLVGCMPVSDTMQKCDYEDDKIKFSLTIPIDKKPSSEATIPDDVNVKTVKE